MWAQNPKFKAILAREKYRQGGHGKENDDDVDAGQGDVLATSAFLAHFMKKVERLEKAGEKTQWKKGTSGSKDTQWGKGESGSKENQWVSPCGKGSFGVTGSQQTYNSMSALAKRIGVNQQSTSKAWTAAMKMAPPFAQSVCFKCKHHELVFYKEVDSGKN